MNRRLSSIAIGLVAAGSLAASLSSCNAPSCGQGTVQKQQPDGTLKCELVDVPQPLTPCDTDGGNVVIVGGKCVSAIQCDPGTTMNENGICVGIGGGAVRCRKPAAGLACIDGSIYNFTDNKKGSTPIHLELYDPILLLSGGGPTATYDSTDGASFVFQDFVPPNLGLVAIVTGKGTTGFVTAGSDVKGATDSARAEHVDLAVLDLAIEDGSTFPVAEILRERGIPFIFVTGLDISKAREQFGRMIVLKKPFGAEALREALSGGRIDRREGLSGTA